MFCVGGMAPCVAVNEMLAGLTVRPDTVDGSEGLPPPPPPSPPPPQAASSSTRAAHSPCSRQEARLIKLPPFCFVDRWRKHPVTSLLLFSAFFWRRFVKNSSTTGKGGQRFLVSRCNDIESRCDDTKNVSRVLQARIRPEVSREENPRGRVAAHQTRRIDGAGIEGALSTAQPS